MSGIFRFPQMFELAAITKTLHPFRIREYANLEIPLVVLRRLRCKLPGQKSYVFARVICGFKKLYEVILDARACRAFLL